MTADAFRHGPDWGHLPWPARFALRHLLGAAIVWPHFVSFGIDDAAGQRAADAAPHRHSAHLLDDP